MYDELHAMQYTADKLDIYDGHSFVVCNLRYRKYKNEVSP